jgi:hypothetical protein
LEDGVARLTVGRVVGDFIATGLDGATAFFIGVAVEREVVGRLAEARSFPDCALALTSGGSVPLFASSHAAIGELSELNSAFQLTGLKFPSYSGSFCHASCAFCHSGYSTDFTLLLHAWSPGVHAHSLQSVLKFADPVPLQPCFERMKLLYDGPEPVPMV